MSNKATRKYQVIQGKHIENGKTYKKGQVIESSHDLIKKFPLKFTLVPQGERFVENIPPAPATLPKRKTAPVVVEEEEVETDNDETEVPKPKGKGIEVVKGKGKAVKKVPAEGDDDWEKEKDEE